MRAQLPANLPEKKNPLGECKTNTTLKRVLSRVDREMIETGE